MRRSLAEAIQTEDVSNVVMSEPNQSGRFTPKEIVTCMHEAALEAKGIEAVVLDVSKSSSLADFYMVLSGRSDRHAQGLANKILEALQRKGIEPYSVQGMEEGHWIVIDTVDVVVHIFYEPLRDRYDLESLWLSPQPAPVEASMPVAATPVRKKRIPVHA